MTSVCVENDFYGMSPYDLLEHSIVNSSSRKEILSISESDDVSYGMSEELVNSVCSLETLSVKEDSSGMIEKLSLRLQWWNLRVCRNFLVRLKMGQC